MEQLTFSDAPSAYHNGEPISLETEVKHTNRCYVLMGLPCTGKSRWTDSVLKNWRGKLPQVVCEDDIIDEECKLSGENYVTVASRILPEQQKRITQEQFYQAIGVRRDIIIDRHNLTQADRREFLDELPDHYQKIGVTFYAPKPLIMERLQRRFTETGRPFCLKSVNAMMGRFQKPTPDEFLRYTSIDHSCQF